MKSSFLERCIIFLLGVAMTLAWGALFLHFCTFAP